MQEHSILSPSSSERWLKCTRSVKLGELFEKKKSEFTKEGTDAHAWCEYKLRVALDQECEEPKIEATKEMDECADDYVFYIGQILSEYPRDAEILIEQRLDLSDYIRDGIGRADCIVAGGNKLDIIDYKHGQGVLVEARNNTQMMIYALGALALFKNTHNIEEVRMSIVQPRLNNISYFRMDTLELYAWACEVLLPKAKLAYAGLGEYVAGEHCRFCPALATCREKNQELLDTALKENDDPETLSDDEISAVLQVADETTKWIGKLKEYALDKALNGKIWKGMELVRGRGARQYMGSETDIANAVMQMGYDPYEKKLLPITRMEKIIGRKNIETLVTKVDGKLKLVPMKRNMEE